MNKIQKTKFNHVGEFLDFLPEKEFRIAEQLRQIIFDAIPDCREKLSYNVPFFYRHSRICFIWPASVPWGGLDAGVALGFCRGDLLSDPSGRLKKGNRKFVRSKIFLSEKEIEPRLLVSFLIEARDIDEKLQKK